MAPLEGAVTNMPEEHRLDGYTPQEIRAFQRFHSRMTRFNSKDLREAELAIAGLDDAYGSVTPLLGERPMQNNLNPWVIQKFSKKDMTALWRYAGIPEEPSDDFQAMLAADDEFRCIRMDLIKYKASLFSRLWLGTVALMYGEVKMNIGTIRGSTQAELWLAYRRMLDFDTSVLHDSPLAALRAV